MSFHANLDRKFTIPQDGPERVVTYNSVVINIGDAYNPLDGKFTAPDAGVYSFSWTSLTPPGKRFETRLMVTGKAITGNRANAIGLNQYVSASKSAIVYMKTGDTAYIQTLAGGANELHGDKNKVSSFCGYRVATL